MRSRFLITTVFCATTALAACDQAESPSETAREVSAAREEARDDVYEARRDANQELQDAGRDSMNTSADAP